MLTLIQNQSQQLKSSPNYISLEEGEDSLCEGTALLKRNKRIVFIFGGTFGVDLFSRTNLGWQSSDSSLIFSMFMDLQSKIKCISKV